MWTSTDPDGRRVVLTRERRLHILERHKELRSNRHQILASVALLDKRLPGREAGEEWFYRRGVGPTRWLKVVVHYEGGEGRILTAFPRRSFP